jgi:hypothetical protein
MKPSEFDDSMIEWLSELSVDAVPILMERMKEARGNIDWVPVKGGSPTPPRFVIQWAIKEILRRDFLRRHPDSLGVSWREVDDSIALADWWETAREKIAGGQPYELPAFMIPFRSIDEIKAILASPEVRNMYEAMDEQRRRFAQEGYRTLREMDLARAAATQRR